MRRPIIAGNWKMNKTVPEAVRLAKQIKLLVEEDARERVEVVLCPPFTALHAVGGSASGQRRETGRPERARSAQRRLYG